MSDHNNRPAVSQAARDRAAIMAGTLFLMVADAVREWLDGAPLDRAAIVRRLADRLRDDYAELARDILSERNSD
jgi:acyl-CoA reductase-like NAD-dependent aldehyde dehydrogenase